MRQLEIAPGLLITNDRCAILSSSDTLILGDLHLGVEASLELEGLQLPRAQSLTMRQRIESIIEDHHPKRIVVLGDLKHEFSRNLDEEWREVRGMLEYLGSLAQVTVVRGNHDNFLANITSRLGLDLVDRLELDGYHLVHGHTAVTERPLIQGHEHPSIRLFDGIGGYLKLPAFLHFFQERVLVLPAFSPLAAGNDINKMTSDDMLSPGLKGADLEGADIYGCSDIGLIRLGRKGDLQRGRDRAP
ncbi:MAG TPA: metallophosphoesterase [Methanomassiliicoccales archaeon]|nr:metallophosphoesterase [Methanomassiliicoccales archaeon]